MSLYAKQPPPSIVAAKRRTSISFERTIILPFG